MIGGAAVAVLALVLARPWQKITAPPPVAEPAKAAPAAAPDVLSPARQLAERAWTILNQGSLTRAQLDAAGELCDRALQLDSTDAVVWARAAAADLELIYPYGYDRSDERRRRAQERAARATSLGADLFEVRVVQAMVFAHAVGTPALLAEAEKTFRDLIPRHPDDPKLVIQLAEVLREQKRYEEAAKMFESIAEFEVAGWSYYEGGQLRAALAAVSRSRRSVTGLQLKAILQLEADEDLAAAQKTVDQLQPSELLAEMPAAIAIRIALYRRDPRRMLELAQGLTQDYLESNAFHGPRRYYTGLAHELAGRNSQAEGEWRSALAVVEARLRSAPENRELLLWSAWLHAALNDAAEAERLFAHSQAIAGLSGDTMDEKNVLVLLRLKRREPLLAWGDRVMQTKPPGWEFAHAEMRFSPLSDFLRGDPHFEKLLRDNLPAGAKPFEDQVSAVSDQRSVSDPKAKTPSPGPLRPPEVDAKSVAVLAFANLSDDKGNEYFSDGISEELLNVLAKIPGLKVAARTSSFHFKGKDTAIAEIAQQLGVAYVVEGSVRKAGDKVRITAQLIKAADGFHVWSDTFTRDLKDIFAVQDEIAGLIAQNLQLKLAQAATRVEVSPEAYTLLLQARFVAQHESNEGRKQAVAYYRQAIAREPGYALAWAEMARGYAMLGRYGGLPMREAMPEARAAAQRALELNPDEPSGHNALGWVLRFADWNWRGARQSFERAVQLAPDNPTMLGDAAVLLFNLGRTDEAIALARRGVERDPLSARARFSVGDILTNADRDAEGVEAFDRGIELAPGTEAYHAFRGAILSRLHRNAEAQASIEREPNEAYRLMAQAMVATDRGDPAASIRARDALIAKSGASMAGWIALVCAHEGERDQAFAWLEQAAQEHDRMIPWVKCQHYLRSLHSDPRWTVFLAKLGLTDEQLK